MPQISYISQYYSNTIQNKLIRRRSEIFLFINFDGSISNNFTTNATQKVAESVAILHLHSFTTKFIFLNTLAMHYTCEIFSSLNCQISEDFLVSLGKTIKLLITIEKNGLFKLISNFIT